jgi:choline dehydrogenase-like flavoprotein
VIADARRAPPGPLTCDVCVVGGGPVGIAIASELGDRGIDVILLESGDRRFTSEAHDLNKGEVVDPAVHGPLEEYRRRRLGGATTAWGGRCVPFDREDFIARDDVPLSGWPFGRELLDPYYRRAHRHLDLGAFAYEASAALAPPDRDRPMIPGLQSDDVTAKPIYRFSPPTNFGAKYAARLASARSVRVLLNATGVKLAANPAGTAVERLEVATGGGPRFTVEARRYVLAGGGLEVTRLLLASNDVQRAGLGNQNDLLGRTYMCHVTHHLDVELVSDQAVWDYEKTADGVYCQRTLAVRPERQRAHGVLNHRARIEHPDIADPQHGNGVLSVSYLAKTVLTRLASNPLLSDKVAVISRGTQNRPVAEVGAHLRNILTDAGGVVRFSQRWIRERILSPRKLPSIVLASATNRYTLRFDAEQVPNLDSRVTLSGERDALGVPRLRVDWRWTELDRHSVEKSASLIGEALVRSGAGRVRRTFEPVPFATGGHHLGTTRMSADPRRGVVDEHCRLHGVANVYVASSSVFPTSSYANPTLTVLALGLRLADRLAERPD